MRVTCSCCGQKYEVAESHEGEHFHCPKCQADVTVQRKRNCPVCRTLLEPTEMGDFEFALVDACPTCSGSWFDHGELNEVAKSETWEDVEHHPYRKVTGDHDHPKCPNCGDVDLTALTPKGDFGLIVDRCDSCGGFWLDKGEIERVLSLHEASEDDDDAGEGLEGRKADKMTPQQILEHRPADWSNLRWMLHVFVHTPPKR